MSFLRTHGDKSEGERQWRCASRVPTARKSLFSRVSAGTRPLPARRTLSKIADVHVGATGNHATVNHCGVKSRPLGAEAGHRRKRPVGGSWRRDETSSKVKGQWDALSAPWIRLARPLTVYAPSTGTKEGRVTVSAEGEPPHNRFLPNPLERFPQLATSSVPRSLPHALQTKFVI